MTTRGKGILAAVIVALWALSFAGAATADDFLPHPSGAKWQYLWTDSAYNPTGTVENVDVQDQQGASFTLAWADPNDQLPGKGKSPNCASPTADIGTMTFQDTDHGLINTNWNSCPPPVGMPILCSVPSPCPNSVASALYNVIWGNRVPVLFEPVLRGVSWNATGGAQNDVTSTSKIVKTERIKVPAYPRGVTAVVVRTNILQAGALGDPYGSGIRTTWWVKGVGPVKIVFDHAGGQLGYGPPPVTTVWLLSTNLKASPPPSDPEYFPLTQGLHNKYRWTNTRHLRQPEVETVTVARANNGSADLTVKSNSGPIRAAGSYLFTLRLDGLTNISGQSAAATLAKLPPLGHGRHFFTPIDLLTFGFNPILPAYPTTGNRWKSGNQSDFAVYGVKGSTKVIGVRTVRVPAGKFKALEVRSVLTQKGYRYGSGVRTCWFAAGRGLVKLVFRHRDGSTSVVQLIK
jgi:hypothetical protein